MRHQLRSCEASERNTGHLTSIILPAIKRGGGGATRLLPRDEGVKKLHGDPTIGPLAKI